KLGALPYLRWLEFAHMSMDGNDIAAMGNIDKLRILSLSEARNVSPVLERLSTSSNIHRLSLTHKIAIAPDDISRIAKMGELRYLCLNDNTYGQTASYKAALSHFSDLDKLECLSIDPVLLDEVPLAKMKHLKTVVIEKGKNLSLQQRKYLASL